MLQWPGFAVVGVMRGAQGSLSSLCVLPGLLTLIVAGVWQILWSCSLSSSEVESSSAGSSVWLVSMVSVVYTLSLNGPRYG